MQLHQQPIPYRIPADLREMLSTHVLEYGTGGGIGDDLPACAVWTISNEDNLILGYSWFTEHRDQEQGKDLHLNLAILPEHQGSGIATLALNQLEPKAAKLGFQRLNCQVNSSCPNSGQRVRRWLFRMGYKPYRDSNREPNPYNSMPDEEFIANYPLVVYFSKPVALDDT